MADIEFGEKSVLTFQPATVFPLANRSPSAVSLTGHGLFGGTDRAFACCNDQRRKLPQFGEFGPHQ